MSGQSNAQKSTRTNDRGTADCRHCTCPGTAGVELVGPREPPRAYGEAGSGQAGQESLSTRRDEGVGVVAALAESTASAEHAGGTERAAAANPEAFEPGAYGEGRSKPLLQHGLAFSRQRLESASGLATPRPAIFSGL